MTRGKMDHSAESALKRLLSRHALPEAAAGALGALLDLLATPEAPTSIHDPLRGVDVHVADSLAGLEVPELQDARRIADLGSGAGLPGLVLATVLPTARFLLIESAGRRCEFLRRAALAMELANVDVVCTRAEEWRDGRGTCDAICARAVARLPILCEYAAPLLREGGVLVAWKGIVDGTETADGRSAAAHLGLAVTSVRSVTPYPQSERRTLHVLRKVAPTPPRYPRRPGMATKRPLSATNIP